MKALLTSILAIGLCINLSSCVVHSHGPAQYGDWEKLGERSVDWGLDNDNIMVTAYEGAFTKLKIGVLKAPIHIVNIKITYANGDVENHIVDRKVSAGADTGVIDLPGNKRIIQKITFNYKSVPTGNGKAVVVVYGKH